MEELKVKKKLYSQLVDLYDGIREYIDEDDKILDEEIFMSLPVDEALKEVFAYRDTMYAEYKLLNNELIEMFDIELPDMDLRGYDLRNLHLTNFVPGTFDDEMNFVPSTVNMEGTNCVVNLNTVQYVQNLNGYKRCIDLSGYNFQGCNLYGRITENLGEGCHKKIVKAEDDSKAEDPRDIDVIIGENTLTESYKRRMERTVPLKQNERYTYERILKRSGAIAPISREVKLTDMDLSEAELYDRNQLGNAKILAHNDADISYSGAYIYRYGTHTLGRENYYLDLNKGLILAIKNGEDIQIIKELIEAGADPTQSFIPLKDSSKVIDWGTPASMAILQKDPKKAKEYLSILIENGVDLESDITVKSSRDGNSVNTTKLTDYKVVRDYLWERVDDEENILLKKYPDLEDRLKKADEFYGTERKEDIEIIPEENETPEEALSRKNKEKIKKYLKENLDFTDEELGLLEKRDPEFFKRRTVKDDLDIKLKLLGVNGLGKQIVLANSRVLNHTTQQIYARTKFLESQKLRLTPEKAQKIIFMPKTKFAENYGRRLVKRDNRISDRQYVAEVDAKLMKKYRLPENREKVLFEIRMMGKTREEEK